MFQGSNEIVYVLKAMAAENVVKAPVFGGKVESRTTVRHPVVDRDRPWKGIVSGTHVDPLPHAECGRYRSNIG